MMDNFEAASLISRLRAALKSNDPAKAKLQIKLAEALTEYASTPHEEHDCDLINGLSSFFAAMGTENLERLFVETTKRLGQLVDDPEVGAVKVEISARQRRDEDDEDEKEILL